MMLARAPTTPNPSDHAIHLQGAAEHNDTAGAKQKMKVSGASGTRGLRNQAVCHEPPLFCWTPANAARVQKLCMKRKPGERSERLHNMQSKAARSCIRAVKLGQPWAVDKSWQLCRPALAGLNTRRLAKPLQVEALLRGDRRAPPCRNEREPSADDSSHD